MIDWLMNNKPNASSLSVGGYLARAAVLLVSFVLLYQVWIFLHICWWIKFNPSSSAFMEDRLEVIQEKRPEAELKHKWVDYEKISNNLKRAVIASEDAKFLDHEGFDWEGIQKAYEKNLKKGKIVAGGSTISQQLAKNLFLSTKRTPWRKAQEAIITVMLEKTMSKRRILEIYLNVIEWGNGVFGAEAAARHYYKTSAARLSKGQAARLAAMIPNPRFYDKHQYTRYLNRRTGTIQARMHMVPVP
ncbi:monofunctional biosynthetic peptidoglycan transglycosylase [Methylotenera sp.]|jgi:monofunctional biosynthetic peptidoglycan transglycosylase|uniref:monofunctional biosynthetic peptidoglycan transglycosylase n=1 Tax=Methylotenera sp. TaxID=2051956 RepID=UPI0027376C37|nr:monofunctional biosynthetic peptidoglycan transglycosylase [Methylotenera sp.]MDP3777688.1 monofunctional biosynthetic peptidoglycan transglycosylase [Methylotenera sp.]